MRFRFHSKVDGLFIWVKKAHQRWLSYLKLEFILYHKLLSNQDHQLQNLSLSRNDELHKTTPSSEDATGYGRFIKTQDKPIQCTKHFFADFFCYL